jgi:hypothetical protein
VFFLYDFTLSYFGFNCGGRSSLSTNLREIGMPERLTFPLYSASVRTNTTGLRLSRLVPATKMASSSMTATSASEEENPAQVQGRSGWEGSEVTSADIS